MARRASGGPTKSELIRDYRKEYRGAGPTEIADTVLTNAGRKGREGGRAKAAGGDAVQTLVQGKRLADPMGGIDKARMALNALARILG